MTALRIYELDLQSWHWRRLTAPDIPFEFDTAMDTIATAVVQVTASFPTIAHIF